MKIPIFKARNSFIISIVWGVVILLACTLPANRVSKISLFGINYMDKVFHFLVYFIFSLIIYFDLSKSGNALRNKYFVFIIIFLIPLVWGIIIELIQFYALLNREGSIADIMANVSGIITGVLFILITEKYLMKK